jgi:hypothetical protein
MEVQERLLQRAKPAQPHLRRRESVHPCDHADAAFGRVCLKAPGADLLWSRNNRLVDDADRNRRGGIECARDLLRVRFDSRKNAGAVKPLAPCEQPRLVLLKLRHSLSTDAPGTLGIRLPTSSIRLQQNGIAVNNLLRVAKN